MKRKIAAFIVAFAICTTLTMRTFAAVCDETPVEYGERVLLEMNRSDDELKQFIDQYGCEEVQTQTTYYVTEYSISSIDVANYTTPEKQELESCVTAFSEYPLEYISQLENQILPTTITPPGKKVVDYSVLQVTLSVAAGSQNGQIVYFIRNSFVWIKLPTPGYTTNIMGVIGIALNPQLTIVTSSATGKFNYSRYASPGGGSVTDKEEDIVFNVPTSTDSIGATFNFTHQSGSGLKNYLTEFSGYVNCRAYKSASDDQWCSVLGIYEDVDSFGFSNEVSISFPAGVSFSLAAVHTPYNVQAAVEPVV